MSREYNPYEPLKLTEDKQTSVKEKTDDGGNAFPAMLPGGNYMTTGMSLRDWFAG